MKKRIKNLFIYGYIAWSIFLWVVTIGGADSIIENKLVWLFASLCFIDILIGKTKPIQDFINEHIKK